MIRLYNRDRADLRLKKVRNIEDDISEWKLTVDPEHEYCLKYMRIIGDFEAVDPSGGPMISLGDKFEPKYEIVKIINPTTFWLSEGNKNN